MTLGEAGSGRCLFVILHAFSSSPEALAPAVAAASEALSLSPDDILCPALPLGLFSSADPNIIAASIVADVDAAWGAAIAARRPYQRIILCGHSYGALLARKVYVIACGDHDKAPLEPAIGARGPTPWAGAVIRIVLLAGMNSGWRISHHLGILNAILWSIGKLFGRAWQWLTGRQLAIMHIHYGSVFLTQLRIQWLWMRRRAGQSDSPPGSAETIQLLGTVDDMVSPKDNIDLVSGGDFLYLDVPMSGHKTVIEMDDPKCGQDGGTRGEARAAIFRLALSGSKAEIEQRAVIPDDLTNILQTRPAIDEVIFVIHGIRDHGYWTHRIAREVRKQATCAGRSFASETSSYGYFPMLPFLATFKRREKVQWLMDQYAEAVALYPDANKFHFVGHSNGTYCLATALAEYPCCHFDNVVLAGSVLPTRFDWSRFRPRSAGDEERRRQGSARNVLNFVATADWVVAIFPKLFQYVWRSQRLGSAGHDGFRDTGPHLQQIAYVRGTHGAALDESNWSAIARFILDGRRPQIPAALECAERNKVIAAAGKVPLLWWLLLAGLLLALIPWAIVQLLRATPEWVATLGVVGYFLLLFRLLTRL